MKRRTKVESKYKGLIKIYEGWDKVVRYILFPAREILIYLDRNTFWTQQKKRTLKRYLILTEYGRG